MPPTKPLALYAPGARPAWARDHSCPLYLRSSLSTSRLRSRSFYHVETRTPMGHWAAIYVGTHRDCHTYLSVATNPIHTYRITYCSHRQHRINCRRHGLTA